MKFAELKTKFESLMYQGALYVYNLTPEKGRRIKEIFEVSSKLVEEIKTNTLGNLLSPSDSQMEMIHSESRLEQALYHHVDLKFRSHYNRNEKGRFIH